MTASYQQKQYSIYMLLRNKTMSSLQNKLGGKKPLTPLSGGDHTTSVTLSVPQGYLEKQGLPTVRDVTCGIEEASHKGKVPKSDIQTSHFLSNSESRFLKSFIWNIKANEEMLQTQVHKKFHIFQLLQQKLCRPRVKTGLDSGSSPREFENSQKKVPTKARGLK